MLGVGRRACAPVAASSAQRGHRVLDAPCLASLAEHIRGSATVTISETTSRVLQDSIYGFLEDTGSWSFYRHPESSWRNPLTSQARQCGALTVSHLAAQVPALMGSNLFNMCLKFVPL